MRKENYLDCRTCQSVFNANHPSHKSIGFYDQCYDCAVNDAEVAAKKKVKGIVNYNEAGDFTGLTIVPEEVYEKIVEGEKEATAILSHGEGGSDE